MKIGIIVAMSKELNLLLPLMENKVTVSHNNIDFHCGTIGPHRIFAMQSGIGKVNAAIATQTMIDVFTPELIINTGVAGGTGTGAGVMDVVVGERIAYHDVWCGPGTIWGQAAGCPRYFTSVPQLVKMSIFDQDSSVHRGLIASGDIFVSKPEEVERFRELYPDVMAVDMESAAIAHVCHLKGTPFFAMRVISDTPGSDDNISQYENFWDRAPEHTFDLLRKMLNDL
ncbi:MAG: 5'-methylthioadenosine/adenosylhomocysteine nucleosidase [Clostridiales bacterium]|nr:5'-methylthioadenosine/adenosylhomocysteine nucleosidase [Clostridiales bacterium]